MTKGKLKNLWALVALLLICFLSPYSIHFTGRIDISSQSLWVILIPAVLAWRGVWVVVSYVVLGLIGLPVFSDHSSGIEKIYGPSGGFIVGFILVAIYIAAMAKRFRFQYSFSQSLNQFILAQVLLLFMGFGWIWFLNIPEIHIWTSVKWLIPGLIVKAIIGALLAPYLCRRLDPEVDI